MNGRIGINMSEMTGINISGITGINVNERIGINISERTGINMRQRHIGSLLNPSNYTVAYVITSHPHI